MDPRLRRALAHLRSSAADFGYPHAHLTDEQLLFNAGAIGSECLRRGSVSAFVAAGLLTLGRSARGHVRQHADASPDQAGVRS